MLFFVYVETTTNRVYMGLEEGESRAAVLEDVSARVKRYHGGSDAGFRYNIAEPGTLITTCVAPCHDETEERSLGARVME